MPPTPALNKQDDTLAELTFEMAEVYELALLRDIPFSAFRTGSTESRITSAIQRLNDLPYAVWVYRSTARSGNGQPPTAKRKMANHSADRFSGSSYGVDKGPYSHR